MVVDNNWKAHSKTVRDAWAKSGIAVWPGAGIVGDRALGFLISLIKMKVNLVDFSLIRLIAWCKIKVLIIRGKILLVDFVHFSETQAFATDYRWIYQRHKLTWEDLSQEKIQNVMNLQPKIMQAILAADGGHTNYMSSGSAS